MKKGVLVLLHGLGQNKHCFDEQLVLNDTFDEVIPIELLGHGENTSNDIITIENMARDVLSQLDCRGINEFHLLGLSLGSLVAQEIIRQSRSRVKSLIVANGLSVFPLIPTSILELYKPLIVECPKKHLEAILSSVIHIKTPSVIERVQRSFSINQDTYERCARSALYVNYSGLLNGLNIPVLIITSTYDSVTSKWFGQQSYACLPIHNKRKQIVELPCGHISSLEMPKEFNKEIRNFFKKYINKH